MRIKTTLFLALFCLGSAHTARAGCLLARVDQLLTSANPAVVFRGLVVALTATPFQEGSLSGQDQRATFLVTRVWKGDVPELVEVRNHLVQSWTPYANEGIANPAGGLLELYREYLVGPRLSDQQFTINGYSCVMMPFEWVQVRTILGTDPGRVPSPLVPNVR